MRFPVGCLGGGKIKESPDEQSDLFRITSTCSEIVGVELCSSDNGCESPW